MSDKTGRAFGLPAVAGWVMVLLSVCAGCGTTPPSRFYLLEAVEPDTRNDGTGQPHIGIRRVEIPEYLGRNEIVFRKGDAEVELAPLHRWAEPLRDSVPRVLAENISTLLNTERISVYPWTGGAPPDYEVAVRIVRFDAGDDGLVRLVAHWQVARNPGQGGPVVEKSLIKTPVAGEAGGSTRYGRIALAHSRALAELARQIVETVSGEG